MHEHILCGIIQCERSYLSAMALLENALKFQNVDDTKDFMYFCDK